MKTSHLILMAAAILPVFASTSCSTFKELTARPASKDSGTKTLYVSTPEATETSPAPEAPKPPKSKPAKKKKGKKPAAAAQSHRFTTDIAGDGYITAAGTTKIESDEEAPYIHFDKANPQLYAFDGCNYINGAYAFDDKGVLSFSGCVSTMKYCADVPYAALIGSLLSDKGRYTVERKQKGLESTLYLRRPGSETVELTLRHNDMDYANGNWIVTEINGKAIDDPEANIFIDIHELKVHGNTGCNYFNGQLYIDPAKPGSIDFSNMGVTRMACPKLDQEQAMLLALEQTVSAASADGGKELKLLDKSGKALLVLKKAPEAE